MYEWVEHPLTLIRLSPTILTLDAQSDGLQAIYGIDTYSYMTSCNVCKSCLVILTGDIVLKSKFMSTMLFIFSTVVLKRNAIIFSFTWQILSKQVANSYIFQTQMKIWFYFVLHLLLKSLENILRFNHWVPKLYRTTH